MASLSRRILPFVRRTLTVRCYATNKDEMDMTYKELASRKVVPRQDTSSFQPMYDPNLDDDKKTMVTILNRRRDDGVLLIDTISPVGFRLNNGVSVFGPMALFPKTVFAWQVPDDISEWTEEAFSLFYLLDPKLDLLVIGVGDEGRTLNRDLEVRLRRDRKLNLEILKTEKAVTTLNFLVDEGRNVAGAFFPQRKLIYSESDLHFRFQRQSHNREEGMVDFSPSSFVGEKIKHPVEDIAERKKKK